MKATNRTGIVALCAFLALIISGVAVLWNVSSTKEVPVRTATVVYQSGRVLLQNGYLVKDNKVYWVVLSPKRSELEVSEADPLTFEDLENGWGKDKSHVFFNGSVTEPADSSVPKIHLHTLVPIRDTFYVKDDQAVYFSVFIYNPDGTGTNVYRIFPDADAATFEIVVPLQYAKDKNSVWNIAPGEGGPAREKIEGANPAECTVENPAGCDV